VRDELAGDRVKCPVCGEIRIVPLDSMGVLIDDEQAAELDEPISRPIGLPKKRQRGDKTPLKSKREIDRGGNTQESLRQDEEQFSGPKHKSDQASDDRAITRLDDDNENSIIGRPVDTVFRILVPSMFGHTVLRIDGTRLIEETQRAGSFRHSEFNLEHVTGAEIRVARNRGLLMCGLMTLPIGIGLIPLIAFFLVRYRLLIVYFSSANTLTVSVHTLEEEAYAFLDLLLDNRRNDTPTT
jgi:hypothetical protein